MDTYIAIIVGFYVLLWLYSSVSKLIDLRTFRHAMSIQVFPKWIGKILVFILPTVEIALAILLLIPSLRRPAMYASLFLMIFFTIYVGGAVFKFYQKNPCACGGLFARLNWKRHFVLNIIITIIGFAGVLLIDQSLNN
jgi:hypothetical protein